MVDEEVTIEVLKEKIAEKLNLSGPLDLLQSDRRPSIEAKSQLKKTKMMHVRPVTQRKSQLTQQMIITTKREVRSERPNSHSTYECPVNDAPSSSGFSKPVPKSIMKHKAPIISMTPSEMMNLG